MLILQDQKLFESLALKKQKEKLQTPLFLWFSGEVLPSVYTWISAGVETRAYTSKGKFCLSAVQTLIIS